MNFDTLIICYGNDLMGNDSFGKAVYDVLPQNLQKIYTLQLLPELLEKVKEFDNLIFVDAAHGNAHTRIYEISGSDTDTADFHHLSAEGFLRLLEALYSKTPKAYMCAGYFEEFETHKLDYDFWRKRDEAVGIVLDAAQALKSN
ncbi:MAG TPA: hydrogenase maturation protease [Campylobacterales bacterium]|nr:hydrogenase maturation protease [Campylobacterales bacterium]